MYPLWCMTKSSRSGTPIALRKSLLINAARVSLGLGSLRLLSDVRIPQAICGIAQDIPFAGN
jgi:hypothetical protein